MKLNMIMLVLLFSSFQFAYLEVGNGISVMQIMVYVTLLYMLIYLIYKSLSNKIHIISKFDIVYFLILILTYTLINFNNLNLTLNSFLEIFKFTFYIFFYFIVTKSFIKLILKESKQRELGENIIKIYMFVLIVNVIIIFLQVILFNIFNINLGFKYQTLNWGGIIRPTGLFGEPAHFGIFAAGVILLRKEYLKQKMILCTSILLALIISGSIINYIVAFLFMIKIFMILKINVKKLITISIGVLILTILLYSLNPSQFERLSYAVESGDEGLDSSTLIRVFKGPLIFNNLPLEKKIAGLGVNNENLITQYIKDPSLYQTFTSNIEYFSGIGYELVILGLVLFLLLNCFYYNFLGKSNIYFFLVFEVLRLGASISFSSSIIPIYIILYGIFLFGEVGEKDL